MTYNIAHKSVLQHLGQGTSTQGQGQQGQYGHQVGKLGADKLMLFPQEVGKFDFFPILLVTGYKGPRCPLLNQLQTMKPLDRQKQVCFTL